MKPRIESRFSSTDDGIIVKYLESQYYTKIVDNVDFERYKSLVLSYEAKEGHTDSLDLDLEDSVLTPENLFAQICADIDVIYSFNDKMLPENILSYDLNSEFTTDGYDNLTDYSFTETGFVLEGDTGIDYNYVSSTTGTNYSPSYTGNSLNTNNDEFYSVSTTGYDERDNPSEYTFIGATKAGDAPVWNTGGTPSTPTNWAIYDDTTYREWNALADNWLTVTDVYEFEGLPWWASQATTKELKIELWYGAETSDTNKYCELYLYDWLESEWRPNPEVVFDYDSWDARSITISPDEIMYDKVHMKIVTHAEDYFWLGRPQLWFKGDYCFLDLKYQNLLQSDVSFNFDSLLVSGLNDFYLDFSGKTFLSDWTSKLLVNNENIFEFDNTEAGFTNQIITDVEAIKVWIANNAEEFYPGRRVDLDLLRLKWINQPVNISVSNLDPINVTSSYSRTHTAASPIDSGMYDDPYFGNNSLKFTIKNTITTPKFGRSDGSVYADSSLSDLDLKFTVYPNSSYLDSSYINVEGYNDTRYDTDLLNDYEIYSTSRFRHSAMDDIQIPLMTPIELDFGSADIDALEGMDLEIALNLDFNRSNAASDFIWSLRFRLMYYNYSSGAWEDFKGMLRAVSNGEEKSVWGATSTNFAEYLQRPQSNNFLPVSNENDILIKNPMLITSVSNDTISNGVMKLAFMSYVIPSNFSISGAENYFTYERADPQVPIQLSQEVEVLECLFIGESVEIMYPDSAIKTVLDLDQNFRANLSLIDNIGEITAVKGKYVDKDNVAYEYPIFSYWNTSNNELAFNSPMKYLFSSVEIEFIPEIELIFNNGKYYLPNSSYVGGYNFTKPFFLTNLKDDNKTWGTYIHPEVDVGYYLQVDQYGTFVANSSNFVGVPRGSVRFAKRNDTYFYQFSLSDELVYKYNLLNNASDLIGGNLQLELNAGFSDVIYSELSQVTCSDYNLVVDLHQLDTTTNTLKKIGQITTSLDQNFLYYHYYDINLDLEQCDYETNGRTILAETIARGSNYDLYVTVNSTISNCLVDGNLFKGFYAHELLSANLQIDARDSEFRFNEDKVDDAHIEIPQESVILSKIGDATYKFDSSSLKYGFEFVINELRTETAVINQNNYKFSFESQALTLYDPYLDYSGLLFADITYNAFEWDNDYISTLEPITFTFANDYTENITNFLELIIQYNAIPGYDMEKISETSGRLVLGEEEKDASLLNVYMYNYIEDKWDQINFVTYDDYSGTNTFSYVVDRNFITFENYFNDTISGQFEAKAIFTVEEEVGDGFVSKIHFDINSLDANIYYSTPSTAHKVSPEVEFDVDLTEYFANPSVYLEEIMLDLNFNGEIEFDDAFIFSQYALLEENYNIYVRNEYMEWELIVLEDNTITLSRNEIDRLLYFDVENDKHYVRAKIEYDWNCILKMNLGSNSKLEILAVLNLINYDVSVSYTSYEIQRISASESSVPFELAAIYAPNYVNTTTGITNLDDDEDVDVGIFRGFLRNVDTRQRLMLRQKLYYNFTDSQVNTPTAS